MSSLNDLQFRCVFIRAFRVSVGKALWVNVSVAIFFLTVDWRTRAVLSAVSNIKRLDLKTFAAIFIVTNRDSLAHDFAHSKLFSVCISFKFRLIHWIVSVFCDWLNQLLLFWVIDVQLKTAL